MRPAQSSSLALRGTGSSPKRPVSAIPLLGDWLVHSPPQFPSNLAEFRLHATATGSPFQEELSPERLAADESESQEMLDPTFPGICVLPIYVGRSVKAALAVKEGFG